MVRPHELECCHGIGHQLGSHGCDGCCGLIFGGLVEQTEDRIIELLEDDKRLHNTSFEEMIVSKGERRKFQEVCVPFCPGCEAIALIKGENNV